MFSLSIFTYLSCALIASKRAPEAWNGRWKMAHTRDGEQQEATALPCSGMFLKQLQIHKYFISLEDSYINIYQTVAK